MCALGERSSSGIWKFRTSSFKCHVDHSHTIHSSGNIDVRNWVYLFESLCIILILNSNNCYANAPYYYAYTYIACLVLDAGEWSTSRSGRFSPPRRNSDTRWMGDCIGPRHSPGESEKRKLSWLLFIWIMTQNRVVLQPSAIQLRLWILIFNRTGRNLTCVINVTVPCTDVTCSYISAFHLSFQECNVHDCGAVYELKLFLFGCSANREASF